MTDGQAMQTSGSAAPDGPVVDVILTVYNGQLHLDEILRSLKAQTWTNWRLWVRDDGSTDGTLEKLRAHALEDPRILVMEGGTQRLGASGGFSWLLENAAPDAEYLIFCDADDSWLPEKIESTLRALRAAERDESAPSGVRPVLVHTDLVVVDSDLRVIADSFWEYERIRPTASLRRLLVQNTVTGCTMMMNGELRRIIGSIPSAAVMHDWWFALVAACFGRIVSLPDRNILYRQHGANDTGARAHPRGILPKIRRAMETAGSDGLRTALGRSTAQGAALLERYGTELTPEQRHLVAGFAEIPQRSGLTRKLQLIRLGTLTAGWDRSLNLILRA